MADSATKAQYTPVLGMQLQVSTTSSTDPTDATLVFADLAVTIKQPQYQGAASAKIDVTTIASEAKEYALGLSDPGTFAMSGNWKSTDPAQMALLAAHADKKPRVVKATFPDNSAFSFVGLVDQFTWSADPDNVVTATFNMQVTGTVAVAQPPAQQGGN
ncbi:phage tail tube protein [Burkholderia perseverans]|uniref:phage tail tube protein n=1 Tax=Burkholderia perseverans TaxID=2615214 RepID=UPI001FEF9137|nr:phage tail tube protein [Burkholderia perseverans]